MSKQKYFPKSLPALYSDLIIQSNQITSAKYNFDLVDKRIFYKIIEKVRGAFIEKKTDLDASIDLWGNLKIRMQRRELSEVDNVTRLYDKLLDFRSKSISIRDDQQDIWVGVGLINYVKHYKKEDYLEMEVSKELLPHLVELSEQFTAYSLSVAISFKSQFTQRFYELCQRWKAKGYFFYSVEEIKEMFDITDRYKKFSDFKRFILEKAQKELYESFHSEESPSSDIFFEWRVKEKSGKMNNKNDVLEFFIYDQNKNLYGNWELSDYKYNARVLLSKYYPNDKQYILRVIDKMDSIQIANLIFEKLQDKENFYRNNQQIGITEIAKIFRTILKEDFQIS